MTILDKEDWLESLSIGSRSYVRTLICILRTKSMFSISLSRMQRLWKLLSTIIWPVSSNHSKNLCFLTKSSRTIWKWLPVLISNLKNIISRLCSLKLLSSMRRTTWRVCVKIKLLWFSRLSIALKSRSWRTLLAKMEEYSVSISMEKLTNWNKEANSTYTDLSFLI